MDRKINPVRSSRGVLNPAFATRLKHSSTRQAAGYSASNGINYDKETKILSIRLSDEKSADSDARGNVVVDYGKGGKIVNIEIMNISLEEFKKVDDYLGKIFINRKRIAVS